MKDFFKEMELYLNETFGDYHVLLRLNCEGVEDSVIYAAHHRFGNKLRLVCGSLKDVEGVKGLAAFKKLEKFLVQNELLFVNFNTGISSWLDAYREILNLLGKRDSN